jgi:hypothetical protein
MHASFDDRGISPKIKDECPMCRGKMTLTLVEPHPVLVGREIHTYACCRCGPTKPRIVACPSYHGMPQTSA